MTSRALTRMAVRHPVWFRLASRRFRFKPPRPVAGTRSIGSWLDSQTFDPTTREGTERRLRLHILPTLGRIELRSLKPSMIQAWLKGREGAAPASVRIMLVNLSAILGAAVEDGLIPANPCDSPSVSAPRIDKRPVVPVDR